jgi:hypothetical protein
MGEISSLAERALEIAECEIGVCEEPPGSNRGPRVDEYLRSVGLDPTKGAYPWCAGFASWAIKEAAAELELRPRFKFSASCQRLTVENQDRLAIRPEVGAVFVMLNANGTGHCGLITAVLPDGSIATIEGNTDSAGSRTGGQVMRRTRPPGYAVAFLRVE